MTTKAGKWLALGVCMLCMSRVRAQDMTPPAATNGMTPSNSSSGYVEGPGGTESTPGHLSNWITYTRPDCCGPIGGDGPITYDLFLRTGPVIPLGGSFMERILQPGWGVDGGGRTLFYNTAEDAACLVEIGVNYQYNHGNRPDLTFQLFGLPHQVNVLHRTWFEAGLGREWYLNGNKNSGEVKWKAGVDAGGRWGMARLDTQWSNAVGTVGSDRLSDTIGAAFVALYSNLEGPCGCCTWEAGIRLEYDYTWMDILPNNISQGDVMDLNVLLTAGLRF